MDKFWTIYPLNNGIIPREKYVSLEEATAAAVKAQSAQPSPEGYAVMEMMKLAQTSETPVVVVEATLSQAQLKLTPLNG